MIFFDIIFTESIKPIFGEIVLLIGFWFFWRNLVLSSSPVTSNVMLQPGNSSSLMHQVLKGWSRAMSTSRGRSMRSKVESRMRKESGKTLREIRRAKKLKKKLMTDEERLIYNLKRVNINIILFCIELLAFVSVQSLKLYVWFCLLWVGLRLCWVRT